MQLENLKEKIEATAKKNGCQKYPHSKIKVGAVLFKVDVAEWDDGSTSITIDEWIVRSMRRRRGTQTYMGRKRAGFNNGSDAPVYVNITAKIKDVTWVRQSRKVNDFGWSKSISKYHKEQFEVGRRLPMGVFTTPLAALKWALRQHQEQLDYFIEYRQSETDDAEILELDQDIAHKTKSIRLIKSRIKKLANNKDPQ